MKKEKIVRQVWTCQECRKTINHYPDIRVKIYTKGSEWERHWCSDGCLLKFIRRVNIVEGDYSKERTKC